MLEFIKVDAPTEFPAMCATCSSQKGPLIATGIVKAGYGYIYLCSKCVLRAGRVVGFVKGDEMTRLENADAALTEAERVAAEKQEMIDRYTRKIGEDEETITGLRAYIETLQSQIRNQKMIANQVAASAKELAVV